jgi:hypothetical protein
VLELESWLIGGIHQRATYCRLRNVGGTPNNTEASPTDPKQWLEEHLANHEYSTRIEECLARHVDLQTARDRNRSMRTFFDLVQET